MINRNKSCAFITPSKTFAGKDSLQQLYADERKALKESFAGITPEWSDPEIQKKLKAFAKTVYSVVTETVDATDMTASILPVERIEPGTTFTFREIWGGNIYYGTYGAGVRSGRVQARQYSATSQLKEAGLKLELTGIQVGKYSPSELAAYVGGLIVAWRNRLLFTTTLGGMACYSASGSYYTSGAGIGLPTLLTGIETIPDTAEPTVIIARRKAISRLTRSTGWTDVTRAEFERTGTVGNILGIPVQKVNSFTDPEYGMVSPFGDDELWVVSSQPIGTAVVAQELRADSETILSNETMNMYWRWEDGFGIWKPQFVSHFDAVS